jgi:hypothetical protein
LHGEGQPQQQQQGQGQGQGQGEGSSVKNIVKKAISRGFSRELSPMRSLSRAYSGDENIFDPSSYQLVPVEELGAEEGKLARMRGSMAKGVPAKQQYGERFGAKTKGWAARIFHSKDYDNSHSDSEKKRGGGGGGGGREGEGMSEEEKERERQEREYREAFGEEEEGEEEGEGYGRGRGRGRKGGGKTKPRQHQRKSRTQVIPVDKDEYGSS